MDIGFDPISLENIKVDKWLKDDKDNIVIFLDDSIKNSKRILLLNKSYFLNPNIKDIYKECIIKNITRSSEIYWRITLSCFRNKTKSKRQR